MQTRTLDDLLRPYTDRKQDALLPVLWDVQTAYGYISADAMREISHLLRVPEANIYGVIEFYSLFHTEPTGETVIRVCTDQSCGLAGADNVIQTVCDGLGIHAGETTADGRYTVEHSPCLGLCDHSVAALISQRGRGEMLIGPVDADTLLNTKNFKSTSRTSRITGDQHVLVPHNGIYDTQSLEDYGDYAALRKVLEMLSPGDVSDEVEQSGLIGRGGAAFPTGMKWRLARQSNNPPHYVVCNADESEPGTFKDRVLMETRPHLVLEGMALCAYSSGAEQGYIFVRGEYPEATAMMQTALDEAIAANLLGERIMGTDFSFHVEIRRGAGAYICGEETALFEAIEGKRGFPRIKPPYPTVHGLFGQPTVVNNVETLAAVPGIIAHGAHWFRQFGTEKSTGTKLVSISGHVQHPAVIELVPGISLRQLIDRHCGGVIGTLQAVLMGGAAGTFLSPDEIDVPLTFEDLRLAGSTFGSGAIVVYNDTVDMRDVFRRLAVFFQHESCGKCFPCQIGTQRQLEIINRMDNPLAGDSQRLQDVGITMTETSLCGLGQTAASAILSAMKRWPALFDTSAAKSNGKQ